MQLLPDHPLRSMPAALNTVVKRFTTAAKRKMMPTPDLTLSEWADEHGYLSDGTKWDTGVVPYLREPMDAVSDRSVREVVVEKPARVGYTEGLVGMRNGFNIHQQPRRTLVVLPTVEDARDWSQKQLGKMIENTPVLAAIVPESRGRTAGNTILDKIFSGGSITIRGAHSPKGLRRHTADDVILDEVDGFEVSSRDEGDPVMLSTRANRTIPDRKTVMGSTPKRLVDSRIHKALQVSDWRQYHMPCPHCKKLQVLEWGDEDSEHGLKWAKDVFCQSCGAEVDGGAVQCGECDSREFETTHQPETAHYVCKHCHEPIEERHKPWMLKDEKAGGLARWIPRYPGRPIRGFQISGLMSPFEGANWANMVTKFLETKDDPALFQVWWNQWLGLPFEEKGQSVTVTDLEARAEQFVGPDGKRIEVPDGVGVLTAGVDVQGDRLEVLVRGYGIGWESWDILHERIYGAPQQMDTWARLEFFLTRSYRHANGRELYIMATMIDSGDGNTSEYVYRFVKPREARNVWASKGDDGQPSNPPLKRPMKANADGVKVWRIGTFSAKSSLFYRLRVQPPVQGGSRKNYTHLRAPDPEWCNGFDREYFAQFGAEEKIRVRVKRSRTYREKYVQTRNRNEAIDLHGGADSAFRSLGLGVLDNMTSYVEGARKPAAEPVDPADAEKRRQSKKRKPSKWVTDY